ncbi:phage tail tape measure protein [Hahella ganghwensis]|uniref:phage tail tape measure protein n=1 Tax=Hahella ganghwensis TaxID=286420 RepID=UPI001FE1B17B|nr:phage tail tape measure protein [Hahella ganghwensis]
MEKLMFTVGLIDQASGTAGKIQHRIDQLTRTATSGFLQVGAGAAGLLATGAALESILSPAIAMDHALNEVKSLGVVERDLKTLEATALRFSIRYGEVADEVVRSSYDIQSAIAGLTGHELARFTEASGVLAKATKSNADTITDYMGTMYGIFQQTADRMGKAQWVDMLTGQTAHAVQMFKTTGAEMARAFANLGAEAQSHGVAMAEQMAILGTLQATMSGSEAGTKYRAFLAGVGKAQDELGLSFTDSAGRLLPMVEILDRIQGRFGDLDTVAKSDALKNAFGSQEAVGLIKLLIQNTDGLAGSLDRLGAVTGMDKAREMAQAMVDPWQQWAAGVTAVKISLGRALLPILQPVLMSLTEGADTITRWTQLFPNLTRVVAIGVLTITGLVAAVSAFALIAGVAKLALAGWQTLMLVGTGIIKAWQLALAVARGALFLFQIASFLAAGGFAALSAGLAGVITATWAFTAALLANPITWIVLGVVALIGALAALVIYWDEVKVMAVTALTYITDKWQWLRGVIEDNAFLRFAFAPLLAAVDLVDSLIKAFAKIPQWWDQFKTWFDQVNPFAGLGNGIDWVTEKLNKLPGLDFAPQDDIEITEKIRQERDAITAAVPRLQTSQPGQVPSGGLLQHITQATTHQNQGVTVEKLEVNTTQPVNGFLLADELAMAGA